MPNWMQPLTLANPIRHFAVIARGVLLKGSGFETLWPNFLVLALPPSPCCRSAYGAFVNNLAKENDQDFRYSTFSFVRQRRFLRKLRLAACHCRAEIRRQVR